MTRNEYTFVNTQSVQNFHYLKVAGGDGKYSSSGLLRMNNYEKQAWDYIYTRNKRYQLDPSQWNEQYGNFCTVGNIPGVPPNLELQALSKLASAARGTELNLGIAIGERKKTVELVVNTVKQLANALHQVKHGNMRGAAKALGVSYREPPRQPYKKGGYIVKNADTLIGDPLTRKWLELQYGWKPLLQDVHSAAKLLEQASSATARSSRITGSARLQQTGDFSAAPSAYNIRGTVEDSVKVVYYMAEQLSAPRSLGLEDPASVAWELLPWSFVFDWFLPVGTYLSTLDVIPKLTGFGCITTVRHVAAGGVSVKPNQLKYYFGCTAQYFDLKISRKTITTIQASSIPVPQWKGVDKALSPLHIANAIALAYQRLR